MPMSSTTVAIPDEDVENRPPSEPLSLSCTNNCNGLSISNSPTVKRNNYMKQRGRRRRWWYFNRGLQPISEVAESKDDPIKCENDDSPVFRDDSTVIENYSSTDHTFISANLPQNKEGYSACLKVIEKFQEVVMDSAVRVIQAAFKRFRERRRFLRIKKAVMVIQRNLRKWLESKHPCIRPANFERQSSDGSKSDEYRESLEYDFDCCVTVEKSKIENSLNSAESEQCQENNDYQAQVIPKLEKNLNSNGKNETRHDLGIHVEKNTLVSGRHNTEQKLNENSKDMEPMDISCLSGNEEEMVESKSVTFSNEVKGQEIYNDVKSVLEELLVKVSSSYPSSDSCEDLQDISEQSKDCENKEHSIDTTDIFDPSNFVGNSINDIEALKDLSYKAKIDLQHANLNNENEEYCKTTADDLGEHGSEKNVLEAQPSPDSLKDICHKVLDTTVLLNSSNMENVGS